ncbi:hypothetical protein AB4Z17_25970 [Paenibacillus sp. TAF43_2]|uniref:hypothetical protein n=1 Tax=Paenibacillus sp. TAF43_2 TaxID=3233069 RepID=UPI003F95C228
MKIVSKYFVAVLSFALLFNVIGLNVASAETLDVQTDEMIEYDRQLDEAYEEFLESQDIQPFIIGPVIGHILKFTMQQLLKRGTSAAVSTTAKNIATNLTKHAIEEAIKDGITTAAIDKLLEGKATGMLAVEKYVDFQTGARVIHDPNSKTIAILDRDSNDMFTIYSDTGKNTIDFRVNIEKRWWKSIWSFK